jgi:hypothetical protein
MDDLFLKQSTLVPDNEIWVSPKTYDNPFSKHTKELGASTNTGSPKLLMPSVGVFIQTGCELGLKGSAVSKLYHAVVTQLRAGA